MDIIITFVPSPSTDDSSSEISPLPSPEIPVDSHTSFGSNEAFQNARRSFYSTIKANMSMDNIDRQPGTVCNPNALCTGTISGEREDDGTNGKNFTTKSDNPTDGHTLYRYSSVKRYKSRLSTISEDNGVSGFGEGSWENIIPRDMPVQPSATQTVEQNYGLGTLDSFIAISAAQRNMAIPARGLNINSNRCPSDALSHGVPAPKPLIESSYPTTGLLVVNTNKNEENHRSNPIHLWMGQKLDSRRHSSIGMDPTSKDFKLIEETDETRRQDILDVHLDTILKLAAQPIQVQMGEKDMVLVPSCIELVAEALTEKEGFTTRMRRALDRFLSRSSRSC